MITEQLLDRTPIDAAQVARSGRIRKARAIVLAAVSITVLLTVATFALPLLDRASEAPRKAGVTYLAHSSILIMTDSDFTSANGVTGGSGISTDPFVINGWEIDASFGGSGILIMSTTAYYQISNVRIYGAGATDMMLYGAPNGVVNNSLFENGDTGILASSSDNLRIDNNTIVSQSFAGMMFSDCSMVEVADNHLDLIETAGFFASYSNNVSVHDNIITNVNGLAMTAFITDDVSFVRNNASSSAFCGLFVNDTRNVTIQENNFTMNSRFGLYIGNVSTAMVFHNRFIGNGEQAFQGPNTTSLAWDDGYPSGGNYWSDYTGLDGDADGIGDTPYSVAGGGTDRYPFMTESLVFVPEFGAIILPIIAIAALLVVLARRRRELC
jgi:parallel beta-helix repeat protein